MPDIRELKASIAKSDEATVVPTFDRHGEPYLASDGTPATFSLLGSESEEFKKRRAAADRKLAKSQGKVAFDEVRRVHAACAFTGWHGWEAQGAPLDCTPEHIVAVLALDHLLLQAEAGIDRRGGFFGSESSSSQPSSDTPSA